MDLITSDYDMTHHDSVEHRSYHTAPSDTIRVRQETVETDGDEVEQFVVRMPITSTAEARDGEAFSRERVEGFREQIERGGMGTFIDHGRNDQTGSRYSALGKVGRLAAPEVVERAEATDLDVDFRFPMPDEVSEHASTLQEVLATLHSQARAGIPLTSSIGWSEDTGERDVPGDADMLEASVVGIPSDARTSTASTDATAMARAVSAASGDFDVEAFVRELEQQSRNTVEVGGEEVDLTPPDAVQNAATVALAKDDELEPDCGTGAGRESARQIAGDSVTAERIDDIAAYLTSHEEDVTADGPPSDWNDEEWQDCGNLQYAMWGGTGTGTGLEWAQDKANEVADAKGDEVPYPERSARNLDDPEFGENDPVEWTSNDVTVRGRVADVGDEFSPAEGVTITGDEGEAVYLIHELDDSLEPPQYRRENVAKPESSLDESQADLPPLEGNFADDENSMSDSESGGDDPADDEREEQPAIREMEEKMDEVREMCERMDKRMGEIHEEMMGGDGDGDDEGEDEDDEEENAADTEDEQTDSEPRTVEIDGEERSLDEAADRIRELRDEMSDEDTEDPKTQDRAAEEDEQTGGDGSPDWRA